MIEKKPILCYIRMYVTYKEHIFFMAMGIYEKEF